MTHWPIGGREAFPRGNPHHSNQRTHVTNPQVSFNYFKLTLFIKSLSFWHWQTCIWQGEKINICSKGWGRNLHKCNMIFILRLLTPSPSASPLTNIPSRYASCWRNKMKKKINNQILYSSFWSIIYGMNSLKIKFFSQEQWSSFSSLLLWFQYPNIFFLVEVIYVCEQILQEVTINYECLGRTRTQTTRIWVTQSG